jgi:D-glycero-D-manno-heptose 1,7-bisphosphate phosphatase
MTAPRAIFLDRDGTLNEDSPDFIKSAAELRVFPWTGPALRRLADAGFALVLISNQSGIARGILREADVAAIEARLRAELAPHGVALLDALYCPHGPDDGCACRKPAPGLILAACARHELDPRRSVMIGDRESDVEAGRRAGCRAILLAAAPPAATRADAVCRDLAAAADWILAAGAAAAGRAG